MSMYEVRVPKWGLSIEQVTVTEWLKQPGDQVAAGDVLCEVETDKSATELESPATGTLVSLVVAEGAVAAVGEVLALIETA